MEAGAARAELPTMLELSSAADKQEGGKQMQRHELQAMLRYSIAKQSVHVMTCAAVGYKRRWQPCLATAAQTDATSAGKIDR